MIHFLYCCFIAFLLFIASPAHASLVSVEVGGSAETIQLKTANADVLKVFFLEAPDRLVVDIAAAQLPSVSLPTNYYGALIKSVRAGQFNANTARIVFGLLKPCVLVNQSESSGVLSLVITAATGEKAKTAAAANKNEKIAAKPEKPMIIIDPGHGGQDPGTIGTRKTQEKDVVLQYAKALRTELLKSGKYNVKLTRDSDVFIVLRDRVKMARAAKGTIFISLHADSAPNDEARGLSVYTVSEKASDAEAEALAARENKVDVLAGIDLSDERQDVADILISLAQRETKNQSALLADHLVAAMAGKINLLPNTHRFAGFAVLKAPDIPSVLVETGFLSHPEEEKKLKSKEYQERLVRGLVEGIDAYFVQNKPEQRP